MTASPPPSETKLQRAIRRALIAFAAKPWPWQIVKPPTQPPKL